MIEEVSILSELVNVLVRLGWSPLYVHDVVTDTDYSWLSFVKAVGKQKCPTCGAKVDDPLEGLSIVCREGVLRREGVRIQRRYWEPLDIRTEEVPTEPFPEWRLRRKLI